LWKNGNVPIALLRWEHLGLTDEVAMLDAPTESLNTKTRSSHKDTKN
jgi:hypothetical protein